MGEDAAATRPAPGRDGLRGVRAFSFVRLPGGSHGQAQTHQEADAVHDRKLANLNMIIGSYKNIVVVSSSDTITFIFFVFRDNAASISPLPLQVWLFSPDNLT